MVDIVGTWIPRAASTWFPDILWRVPTTSKTAYLTFDDGPNPTLTERIIEIMHRYDAQGTFFLLGSKAEKHPSLVRDLLDGGHQIGNHTFSHPDAWLVSSSSVIDELEHTTLVLEDQSGRPVDWMRPPYGRFTRGMRRWCRDRRQRLTMWDLAPGDYLPVITQVDVERHVVEHIRPGSIVVLHDNPRCAAGTPAALESVLQRLRSDGWDFAALPQAE